MIDTREGMSMAAIADSEKTFTELPKEDRERLHKLVIPTSKDPKAQIEQAGELIRNAIVSLYTTDTPRDVPILARVMGEVLVVSTINAANLRAIKKLEEFLERFGGATKQLEEGRAHPQLAEYYASQIDNIASGAIPGSVKHSYKMPEPQKTSGFGSMMQRVRAKLR